MLFHRRQYFLPGLNLIMACISNSLVMQTETAHNLLDLFAAFAVLIGETVLSDYELQKHAFHPAGEIS